MLLDKINPNVFFRDYIDVVVYNDIVESYKVKEPELIKILMKFIASSFSSGFSIHKTFNTLKSKGLRVSQKTLYSYFKYITNSFFCLPLKKFSFSERETDLSIPKVYLCDTGVVNYLLQTRLAENVGRLIENVVFLELKKRELYGKIQSLFYFKTKEGYEVDFLIKEGLRIKQLIQVSYANDFDEIDHREIRALIHANELLKEHKPELLIITWDYEDERQVSWFGKRACIKFLPLWKWLLEFTV